MPTEKSFHGERQEVNEVTDGIKRAQTLRTTLDELLEKAEKEREKASEKYETFRWLSIVFFVLGIAIGLLAQALGLEPVGSER